MHALSDSVAPVMFSAFELLDIVLSTIEPDVTSCRVYIVALITRLIEKLCSPNQRAHKESSLALFRISEVQNIGVGLVSSCVLQV